MEENRLASFITQTTKAPNNDDLGNHDTGHYNPTKVATMATNTMMPRHCWERSSFGGVMVLVAIVATFVGL